MKSLSHGRKVDPIEPDDTIVPDMRFTDRAPLEGVTATPSTWSEFVAVGVRSVLERFAPRKDQGK